MKKLIFTFIFASALTGVNAQTETKTEKKTTSQDFNKWSIELAGGFSSPQSGYTLGSSIGGIQYPTIDLGIRYMINDIFGIKGDVGYNVFKTTENVVASDINSYNTRYYRADLQGVANVGKLLNFKSFTSKLGLLGHSGIGLGMVGNIDSPDFVGNFVVGLTGQLKLSRKFALTADVSNFLNLHQKYSLDLKNKNLNENASILNATIGLTYYLGKSENHADWVNIKDEAVSSLEKRVADLETMTNDSDKDGVVDYLDTEPNTITGVMVDSKGRAIDLNKNNVPDELEKYLERYALKSDIKPAAAPVAATEDVIKKLINEGYISIYYDFNKSTPITESSNQISYILTYLRNNPSASADIIGHADEVGSSKYNDQLAKTRASKIKETLIKAQVAASRLNVVSEGEDKSVDAKSEEAKKLVRRVTFRVK